MNNVIGPISKSDWYTLRMLREAISYHGMRNQTGDKTDMIQDYKNMYRVGLDEILD